MPLAFYFAFPSPVTHSLPFYPSSFQLTTMHGNWSVVVDQANSPAQQNQQNHCFHTLPRHSIHGTCIFYFYFLPMILLLNVQYEYIIILTQHAYIIQENQQHHHQCNNNNNNKFAQCSFKRSPPPIPPPSCFSPERPFWTGEAKTLEVLAKP